MSDTAPDTATTARWPDLTHRTQAQVMADEANMDQVFAAIRAERCRQIEAGHTPARDDGLTNNELLDAVEAHLTAAHLLKMDGVSPRGAENFRDDWTLGGDPTMPATAIANLTRACALLVAEIERQRRAAMRAAAQQEA